MSKQTTTKNNKTIQRSRNQTNTNEKPSNKTIWDEFVHRIGRMIRSCSITIYRRSIFVFVLGETPIWVNPTHTHTPTMETIFFSFLITQSDTRILTQTIQWNGYISPWKMCSRSFLFPICWNIFSNDDFQWNQNIWLHSFVVARKWWKATTIAERARDLNQTKTIFDFSFCVFVRFFSSLAPSVFFLLLFNQCNESAPKIYNRLLYASWESHLYPRVWSNVIYIGCMACVCVRVSLFFVCCCSVSHNIDSTLKEKGRAIYNVCSSIEKRQRTTHQKHTQQVKTIAYNRNYKRNGKEICAISRNCLTSKSKRHLIFVRLGNEQKNNSNNNRKNEKVVLVGEKHHRHTTNYRTMKINGIQ